MVQRAWNYRGTAYQTVRMQFPKMSDFIWPFKSAHPVNVKFNREWWVNGGIVWSGFGTNTGWGYVNLTASPQNKYTMGWGYGPLASSWYDTSSSTSFFHRNGSIINPYAEVYVRPELRSTDSSFRAIGDGGTAAETQKASVSEYASPTAWGVTGNLNGSIQEGNIQVQAFEQVGSTMYVGGNFTGVQKGKNGSAITSNGLAAFDATTGVWTGQTSTSTTRSRTSSSCPAASSSPSVTSPRSTAKPTWHRPHRPPRPARSTPRGICRCATATAGASA